jgi:tetratricopeptide (TPR) repeat protein
MIRQAAMVLVALAACRPASTRGDGEHRFDLVNARTFARDATGAWIPVFDADAPPRVHMAIGEVGPWTLQLAERTLEVNVVRTERRTTIEVRGSFEPIGASRLTLRESNRVAASWPIAVQVSPEQLAPIVRARALRAQNREAEGAEMLRIASTSTNTWLATWAAGEIATWIRQAGDAAEGERALREAARVAERSGLDIEAARKLRAAAHQAITAGAYDRAATALLRARTLAASLDDPRTRGRERYMFGLLASEMGDYRTAELELAEALRQSALARDPNDACAYSDYLAAMFAHLGRYREALRLLDRHAPPSSAPSRVHAHHASNRAFVLASARLDAGDRAYPEDPRPLFDLAREIFERERETQFAHNQVALHAWYLVECGAMEDAARLLGELPSLDSLSVARWSAKLLAAEVAIARRDRTHARELARDVLEGASRERERRPSEDAVAAEMILAELAESAGDLALALRHNGNAWNRLRELGRTTMLRNTTQGYLRKRRDVLAQLIERLVRADRVDEAFEVADRSRAEVLAQLCGVM